MVPRVELPPEVELTDQVTAELEELLTPATVAVKGRVLPTRMLALVGEMETVGAGVGPGVGCGEVEEPHEARASVSRDTSTKRKNARSAGIVRIVWVGLGGQDNWTEGRIGDSGWGERK